MNDQLKAQPKPETKQPMANPKVNPLDQLNNNQKIEQAVIYQGIYVVGAVEPWEYDGKTGVSGFVQLLQSDRDNSAALKLTRVKVPEEQFGLIDHLNKNLAFSYVELNCLQTEDYNKKMKVTLSPNQPSLAIS